MTDGAQHCYAVCWSLEVLSRVCLGFRLLVPKQPALDISPSPQIDWSVWSTTVGHIRSKLICFYDQGLGHKHVTSVSVIGYGKGFPKASVG